MQELYEWQKKAVEICETKNCYALFALMGTGKSRTAIEIMRTICNREKRLHKILILGPIAVVYNWQREILKYSNFKEESIHVSVGAGVGRSKKLVKFTEENDSGIVIINYEGVRNQIRLRMLNNWAPEIMIMDESHMLKSPDSQQSKLVYGLSLKAKYRYILTGTPILNSPLDIFMQYKIMDHGATFGNNLWAFRAYYFVNENATKSWLNFPKWVPNEKRYPELIEKMHQSCIRVKTEECLDLPERIEQVYHVELSKEQRRMYKEMKRDFLTTIENRAGNTEIVVAELALVKALRLQQIVTGFCVTEKGRIAELDVVPRVKAVKELLEQILVTDKCILWCSFVYNYRQLEKLLTDMKVEYVSITGEQNARDKQTACDMFQDPRGPKVCIANRKAAGLGIDLTQAAYSIIYSRNFSLGEEEQANARNYRRGSEIHKRVVKIDLVAKGTIDELVVSALKNKQKISDIIIDRIEEI